MAISSGMNSLSTAGNCPGGAAEARLARAAPGQLGHRGQRPGLRPRRLPPPPPQHPDQLIVADRAQPGVRLVGEPGQRHPRDQHVQRAAVSEPGPASPCRPGQPPGRDHLGTAAGTAASSSSSSPGRSARPGPRGGRCPGQARTRGPARRAFLRLFIRMLLRSN